MQKETVLPFIGMINFISVKVLSFLTEGYRLIVISEEEVPLSSRPGPGNALIRVLWAALVILMVFALIIYIIRHRRLSERLAKLRRGKGIENDYYPLSLKQMRDEINEYESEFAEIITIDF